jgi:hypothetical protein
MAKAYAGPTPWYTTPWAETGTRRVTKKTAKDQGVEWSLRSGYRQSMDLYDERPKKNKMKTVTHYGGRPVEVPDNDFEDYLGFLGPISSELEAVEKVKERIDTATWSQHVDAEGEGHILALDYAPTRQFMRVFFRNGGGIVVHLQVPVAVYSELRSLALNNVTMTGVDGKQRHVLGMRYWDIVRIRHTQHGVRYKFTYTQENTSTAKPKAGGTPAGMLAGETPEQYEADLKDTLLRQIRGAHKKLGRQAAHFATLLKDKSYAEIKQFVKGLGLDIDVD